MARPKGSFIKREDKPVSEVVNEIDVEEGNADAVDFVEVKEEVKEVKKQDKPVYVFIRDINFGQHKVGDVYEGNEVDELLAKEWIKQK